MDGFYVAKIIKLSDRRPEDTLEAEDPDGEGVAETTNPKKMSTTQRRKAQEEAAAKTAGDINTKKKKKWGIYGGQYYDWSFLDGDSDGDGDGGGE